MLTQQHQNLQMQKWRQKQGSEENLQYAGHSINTETERSPLACVVFPQMYLVIFPEGTRYNPELKNVIADSQAFAAKEGTGTAAAAVCCSSAEY